MAPGLLTPRSPPPGGDLRRLGGGQPESLGKGGPSPHLCKTHTSQDGGWPWKGETRCIFVSLALPPQKPPPHSLDPHSEPRSAGHRWRDGRTPAQMLHSCKLLARGSPAGADDEPEQRSRKRARRSQGRIVRVRLRGDSASQLHRHPANPARTHAHTPQPTTPVSSEQHPSSLPRFPNSCGSPRPHPPAALPGPLLHHFGPRRREQAARGARGGGC